MVSVLRNAPWEHSVTEVTALPAIHSVIRCWDAMGLKLQTVTGAQTSFYQLCWYPPARQNPAGQLIAVLSLAQATTMLIGNIVALATLNVLTTAQDQWQQSVVPVLMLLFFSATGLDSVSQTATLTPASEQHTWMSRVVSVSPVAPSVPLPLDAQGLLLLIAMHVETSLGITPTKQNLYHLLMVHVLSHALTMKKMEISSMLIFARGRVCVATHSVKMTAQALP